MNKIKSEMMARESEMANRDAELANRAAELASRDAELAKTAEKSEQQNKLIKELQE